MNYNKRHHAYHSLKGGKSILSTDVINSLNQNTPKMGTYYIGTYSEYNPIGYRNALTAVVRKPYTKECFPQKDFRLPGFQLSGGLNVCSDNFNTNNSISFSKQDLLRIAHAMDEGNELIISYPISMDHNKFQKSIKQVTK